MNHAIWSPAYQLYDYRPSIIKNDAWIDTMNDTKMDESKAEIILICYKGSIMLENLLLFAAFRNMLDLATKITKHGDFTPDCSTAGLFESCKKGYYKITKLLIESGVDIRQQSDSCLNISSKHGHIECVELCLQGNSDVQSNDNYSLIWACQNGHLKVVEKLLSSKAPVGAMNNQPIQKASEYGNTEIVLLLIRMGADVNAAEGYPLRWASTNGHLSTVKALLVNITIILGCGC
jgi:ankyrin repeat protein